jgi:hypothetical protein
VQRISTAVNFRFSRPEPQLFFQVASQLSSRIQRFWLRFPGLPNFLRSSGSGTGFTQPCRQELWPLDHRGGYLVITDIEICKMCNKELNTILDWLLRSSILQYVMTYSLVDVHQQPSNQEATSYPSYLFHLLFNPEDEGNTFLRTVGKFIPDYMVSLPRR